MNWVQTVFVVQLASAAKFFNLAGCATSGGIQVPFDMTSIALPQSEWTLELWLMLPSSSNPVDTAIVTVAGSGGSNDVILLNNPSNSYKVMANKASTDSADASTWTHIAVTSESKMYANAVAVGTAWTMSVSFSKFLVGDRSSRLNAFMAEMHLFIAARTQTQLEQGMHMTINGLVSIVVMNYPLSEKGGTSVHDRSLSNAETVFPSEPWVDNSSDTFPTLCKYYGEYWESSACHACHDSCYRCAGSAETDCRVCKEGCISIPDHMSNSKLTCHCNRRVYPATSTSNPIDLGAFTQTLPYTLEFWVKLTNLPDGSKLYTTNTHSLSQFSSNQVQLTLATSGIAISSEKFTVPPLKWTLISTVINYTSSKVLRNGAEVVALTNSGSDITQNPEVLKLGVGVAALFTELRVAYSALDSTSINSNRRHSAEGAVGTPLDIYYTLTENSGPLSGVAGGTTLPISHSTFTADSGEVLQLCYATEVAYNTGFNDEWDCADNSPTNAVSLNSNDLRLTIATSGLCSAAFFSVIEFWHKGSYIDGDTVADFGNLKVAKGESNLKYTLDTASIPAADPTGGGWNYFYVEFKSDTSMRSLSGSNTLSSVSIAGLSDPCPTQFKFMQGTGFALKHVRWWRRTPFDSSTFTEASSFFPSFKYTSFRGLPIDFLLLDYPLDENSSTVFDRSVNHLKTTGVTFTTLANASQIGSRRMSGRVCTNYDCSSTSQSSMNSGILAGTSDYFACTLAGAMPTGSVRECQTRSNTLNLKIAQSHQHEVTSQLTIPQSSHEIQISFLLTNSPNNSEVFSLGGVLTLVIKDVGELSLEFTSEGSTTVLMRLPYALLNWYDFRYVWDENAAYFAVYINGKRSTLMARPTSLSVADTLLYIGGRADRHCNCYFDEIRVRVRTDPWHHQRAVNWRLDKSAMSSLSITEPFYNHFKGYGDNKLTDYATSPYTPHDIDLTQVSTTMYDLFSIAPATKLLTPTSACNVDKLLGVTENASKFDCTTACSSSCKSCTGSSNFCYACTTSLKSTAPFQSSCSEDTSTGSQPVNNVRPGTCSLNCNSCWGKYYNQCDLPVAAGDHYNHAGLSFSKYFSVKSASSTSIDISLSVSREFTIQFWVKITDWTGSALLEYDNQKFKKLDTDDKLCVENTDGTTHFSFNANLDEWYHVSLAYSPSNIEGYTYNYQSTAFTELSNRNYNGLPTSLTYIKLMGEGLSAYLKDLRVLDKAISLKDKQFKTYYSFLSVRYDLPMGVVVNFPLVEGSGSSIYDCKVKPATLGTPLAVSSSAWKSTGSDVITTCPFTGFYLTSDRFCQRKL